MGVSRDRRGERYYFSIDKLKGLYFLDKQIVPNKTTYEINDTKKRKNKNMFWIEITNESVDLLRYFFPLSNTV